MFIWTVSDFVGLAALGIILVVALGIIAIGASLKVWSFIKSVWRSASGKGSM